MKKLLEILALKKPRVGGVTFIAVDGRGGSGKSTLTQWLADNLEAQIIHTDDFANWDDPLGWRRRIAEYVFKPIASGVQALNYPRSQWWESESREPVVDQPVTTIMLLEGVGSLRRELRKYISVGVFVDSPRDICLQRGIEREVSLGKPRDAVTRLWHAWLDEEEAYILQDNPKNYADIVIEGTKPFEGQFVI